MSLDRDHHQAFRQALGSFATGVTVATTLDEGGTPVGVTASSFNSVSLDPPMVLWSLAKDSFSCPAFAASGHFAIHVLTASQEALSNRFARSGTDKFDGLHWQAGELGSPIFDEFAARFECRTEHLYEGGDHIIMVGEVVDFEARDEAPLLFHGGRYGDHRPRVDAGHEGGEPLLQILAKAQDAVLASETALDAARHSQALERALSDQLGASEVMATRRVLARLAELARHGN